MQLARTLQLAALAATAAAKQQRGLRAAEPLLASTSEVPSTPFLTGLHPYSYCAPVCCDPATEDTCYDDDGPASCAKIADGGCPCAAGYERCGGDPANGQLGYCAPPEFCCDRATILDGGCPCPAGESRCGLDVASGDPGYAGYCEKVCCDFDTQEVCYDAAGEVESCADIASGGCPCAPGETRCDADLANGDTGFCDPVCCDSDTEDTCYDEGGAPTGCAPIATGGCECPAGQVKCMADVANGYAGFCTTACCDDVTEETCYDEGAEGTYDPVSCASIANGGCPCAAGETKCGADIANGYPGFCTYGVCCADDEMACYGENSEASCAKIADGCPCPPGEELCTYASNNGETLAFARAMKLRQPPARPTDSKPKANTATLVKNKGTPREVAYYRDLQKWKLLGKGNNGAKSLEKREEALVKSIELRVQKLEKGKQFAKKNVGASFL